MKNVFPTSSLAGSAGKYLASFWKRKSNASVNDSVENDWEIEDKIAHLFLYLVYMYNFHI